MLAALEKLETKSGGRLGVAVLDTAKAEMLERRIAFGQDDLLEYAPVARARVAKGSS